MQQSVVHDHKNVIDNSFIQMPLGNFLPFFFLPKKQFILSFFNPRWCDTILKFRQQIAFEGMLIATEINSLVVRKCECFFLCVVFFFSIQSFDHVHFIVHSRQLASTKHIIITSPIFELDVRYWSNDHTELFFLRPDYLLIPNNTAINYFISR